MSKKQASTDEKSAAEKDQVNVSTGAEASTADETRGEKRQLDIEVDVDALGAELQQLKQDLQDHKDKYLRAVAEVDNTRRRAESDVSSARKFAVEGFAAEVLSVRDSLELARAIEVSEEDSGVVQKMKEGLDLTLKQLDAVFGKFGIREIEPAVGDKLDPEQHQAMTLQESTEVAPNHIVTAIQKGYSIHGRLIRPAMVIVAKAASKSEAETEAENT